MTTHDAETDGSMAEAREPRPQRILIVDDNVDAAESLATLMRLQGHNVEVANQSSAALDIVERFRPAVAILDIGMPGLNGFELAKAVRRRLSRKDILLIALTGFGREDDRRRGLEAGFDHYMVKPCDPAALRFLVESAPRR